ncbi:TIGR03862 family flavoprotein [Microbacteriaceae bacterium K1510]|nr:TIGR03862 family flavoprotein [Microbacteriaceae bacterium K1510]
MAPTPTAQKTAAIVGGGPAGLMAAEVLARAGLAVTVYDRMPSVGRKFLLAGRGGLNLTHSEDLATFLARYGETDPRLRRAIEAFPPEALRTWCEGLDVPTFVGSSGRVFPKTMKASPLLRAWLRRLIDFKVRFATRHLWTGWDAQGRLRFTHGTETVTVAADVTVLALGGASWPRLGSDGGWADQLMAKGVAVASLQAANCGFHAGWSEAFRRFEGVPLKRIAVSAQGRTERGEAMITRDGLEGGAIYALSRELRTAIARDGATVLTIDLRPDIATEALADRIAAAPAKQSLSNRLRKTAKLTPAAIGLLHEAMAARGAKLATLDARDLATLIKAAPVTLTGVQPVATAISTAGGVRFDALDDRFMLRSMPGVFIAGEMLDWEAPTGGYLLQACFATANASAQGAIAWLHAT